MTDVAAAFVRADAESQVAVGRALDGRGASAARPPLLTARELQVLGLLGDARSTAQIAAALGLLPLRDAGAAGAPLHTAPSRPAREFVDAASGTGMQNADHRRVTPRVAATRSDKAVRTEDEVRVLVLDEQEVGRRGVRQVLADDPAITVVAEAASVGEAVARGLAVRPDVAVVDAQLPDGSGAEAWTRLRAGVPGLRCLVLSAYCDPTTVRAAVSLGVDGYLLKDVRGPALVAAVHRVAAGHNVFSREVVAAVCGTTNGRPDPLDRLAPRELEMLRLLGEGLTNRQIGERMALAEKTVKNYTGDLLGKLGLQRRTQAAILATELRDRLTAALHAGVVGGATVRWCPASGGRP